MQTVPAEDFARTNSPSVTDTLQQRVPGAVSIDINGNPFSQDLFYRGFVASPRQGTPQGIAVYQNGIRVNEVFGDTVNWDLIPPQAIYRAEIFTNNPIFGLNALGGAVSLQMKNGFLWQGLVTQVLGGSFGRVSGLFEWQAVTGDATHDGGWRFSRLNPVPALRRSRLSDAWQRTSIHRFRRTQHARRHRADASWPARPKRKRRVHFAAVDGQRGQPRAPATDLLLWRREGHFLADDR